MLDRIVARRAQLLYFGRVVAEDEDILRADIIANLYIGAVFGADRQRAV